jgi:hypothetical protein
MKKLDEETRQDIIAAIMFLLLMAFAIVFRDKP